MLNCALKLSTCEYGLHSTWLGEHFCATEGVIQFWLISSYFNFMGVNYKYKISKTYFDEKCDLSACVKIKDYNVLLSLYLYLQDNDSYLLSNLILNQIQTSKERMNLVETLFLTRDGTLAL